MSVKTNNKLLYYAPRVIAILGILFISSAALDVFETDRPILEIIAVFFIHLVPSFVLIAVLAIAWRHERVGGILYLAVAVAFFLLFRNPFWVNMLVAGPFLASGILFLIHHYTNAGKN